LRLCEFAVDSQIGAWFGTEGIFRKVPTMTNELHEVLERFNALPYDAILPSRVAARSAPGLAGVTASFGPNDIGSNSSNRYSRPASSSGSTEPQRSRRGLRRSPNRSRRILSSLESLTRGRRPGNPVIAKVSYSPVQSAGDFFV
jgi:hypothetical protein